MSWIYLGLAGLLEIAWGIGLKLSDGLTRPLPTALTAIALVLSVVLLGLAVRHLPLGTAYAVWTGIGASGIAIAGMLFFGDPAGAPRLACIGLIVAGIVGLKLTTP